MIILSSEKLSIVAAVVVRLLSLGVDKVGSARSVDLSSKRSFGGRIPRDRRRRRWLVGGMLRHGSGGGESAFLRSLEVRRVSSESGTHLESQITSTMYDA